MNPNPKHVLDFLGRYDPYRDESKSRQVLSKFRLEQSPGSFGEFLYEYNGGYLNSIAEMNSIDGIQIESFFWPRPLSPAFNIEDALDDFQVRCKGSILGVIPIACTPPYWFLFSFDESQSGFPLGSVVLFDGDDDSLTECSRSFGTFLDEISVDWCDGDFKKEPALFRAVRYGELEHVLTELKRQRQRRQNYFGGNLLHYAIHCGWSFMVELLLSESAVTSPFETRDEDGDCAVHIAAKVGALEVLNVLLDSGADINSLNEYGRTALHCAFNNDIAHLLVTRGADWTISDGKGRSAKEVCLRKSFDAAVALMR